MDDKNENKSYSYDSATASITAWHSKGNDLISECEDLIKFWQPPTVDEADRRPFLCLGAIKSQSEVKLSSHNLGRYIYVGMRLDGSVPTKSIYSMKCNSYGL